MGTNNYIVILDWMVSELGLRGNELLVYALIYGFSQDGESEFTGSMQYVAERVGITRMAVSTIYKKLLSRELIVKREQYIQGVKYCTYRTNFETLSKTLQGVKNLYRGSTETIQGGGIETLHNNKDIENKDNNKDKKNISKDISKKFDVMRYMTDRNVPESVATDFIALRKVKRAPLTETALKGIEREAAKARISLGTAIEVCCANGWQGFRAEWYNKDKGKTPEIYVDPHTDYDDWTDPSKRVRR
jgi:predicted transcriptional regulator